MAATSLAVPILLLLASAVAGFRRKLAVTDRPIKIIQVSSQYNEKRNFTSLESCSLPCTQAANLSDADVVYAYSGKTEPRRAREDQVWVGTFWESPEHYPAKSLDFDYSASWRPDATFARYDMIPDTMADAFDDKLQRVRKDSKWPRRVSFAEKSRHEKKISVWISNCHRFQTQRLDLADRLDKAGVPFASYGKCRHNANSGDKSMQQVGSHGDKALLQVDGGQDAAMSLFLERTHQEPGQRDKDQYDTSSRHLFFFAAENSDCSYYHSEKVYHGLLSGSVPVYVGNGNTIDAHVPKGSIIKASDFKTSEDLAEYIKRVASNETLYNTFFEWYDEDLSQTSAAFRKKLRTRRSGGGPDRCAECAFFHTHGRNRAFDGKALGCDA